MTTPSADLSPIEVARPALTPYRYGLLSAASVIEEPETARWRLHGVVYGSICGDQAGVWLDHCLYPPVPVPVQAYLVTLTKAAGGDVLTATLTARHAGYDDQTVFVNVGGDVKGLTTVGGTQTWDVTPSSNVDVFSSIGAQGIYPACSTPTVAVAVPATGAALAPPVTLECTATPTVGEDRLKTLERGLPQVQGIAFGVIDGITCFTISGRTEPELEAIARERLAVHEQFTVERIFWERELGGLGASAVTVLAPPSGSAWALASAVGALEQAIAEKSGAVGVIHAPRAVGAPADFRGIVHQQGPQLVTALGNLWAFGAGYSNTSPAGVPAPAGQAWLYSTGPVTARRTPVQVLAALSHSTNERQVLAERDYVLTADCPAYAALVQLPES